MFGLVAEGLGQQGDGLFRLIVLKGKQSVDVECLAVIGCRWGGGFGESGVRETVHLAILAAEWLTRAESRRKF
jgi:hypothetical protein